MSQSPRSLKIADISKYSEVEGGDNDFWSDIDLPASGFQPQELVREVSSSHSSSIDENPGDFDGFNSSLGSSSQPSLNQCAFAEDLSKFLASYTGKGSVMRFSTTKRSTSSGRSDWEEDFQVPATGFPSQPRIFSEVDDLDSLFSTENEHPPSMGSTLSRFSSLKSVEEEKSAEEDFQLPHGDLELQLSPPPEDPTFEIDFEDEFDQGMVSDSVRSSDLSRTNFSPYTRESSAEAWDDVVVPSDLKTLTVKPRKPYRPNASNEENWDEDIEIPSEAIFKDKVTQKNYLYRKHSRSASSKLQRNAVNFEFNISRMRENYTPAPRFPGSKDPRRNVKDRKFHYLQHTASTSLVSFHPTQTRDIKMTTSDPATPAHLPFHRPRVRYYGDGTELDALDNLPVPITPKHTSNKMRRINPPSKTEASEKISQLLCQFSEFEVERFSSTSPMARAKPKLIKAMNSTKIERVVGDMKFNPRTQNWEGNEQALKDFDSITPPRPALITNMGGNKRPRRVGDMIFDPEGMRWVSIVSEVDPFAGIPDLTSNDPPIERKRGGAAPGDSFHLDCKVINSMYAAERQHRTFMSTWCETSNSADGYGIGYEHLFDIRDLPPNL